MMQVGIAHHRVLTHDIESLDLAIDGGVQDLHNGQANITGKGSHTPGVGKLLPRLRDRHRLIGGENIGQTAHIAGSLNVILSTKRIDSTRLDAHIPAQHGQVGDALHPVRPVDVLGHAHGVDDRCSRGFGVKPGGGDEVIFGDPGDLLNLLGSVGSHHLLEFLKSFGALRHVFLGVEALIDDHVHHPVEPCHVTSRFHPEPDFGMVHHVDPSGIDNDDLGLAISHRPLHKRGDDGMHLGGVGSGEQNDVSTSQAPQWSWS